MDYREEQRFRQPWLWCLVLLSMGGVLAVFGHGLITQLVFGQPWGDRPISDRSLVLSGLFTFAMGLGMIWLLYAVRLVTEVRADGVHLRFAPLARKHIPFSQIASCQARDYQPLQEYGGWGIRWGFRGNAWNVSGHRGAQLELRIGKPFLIGSQRAEELASAINTRLE